MAASTFSENGNDPLGWRCRAFDALTVTELDAIYRVRQQVFVIEQGCPYLDADGCDSRALHLAAWPAHGETPIAYARVLQPRVKYAEPSIGRVLTVVNHRGTGLGRELIRRAIDACRSAHRNQAIRISAQARLEALYTDFGFTRVGEPYQEDNIPHIEMLLSDTTPPVT